MGIQSQHNFKLRLPNTATEDFTVLIQKHADLSQIINATKKATPASGIRIFCKAIADEANLPLDTVEKILHCLWNLKNLQQSFRAKASSIINAITDAINNQFSESWKKDYLDVWNQISSKLSDILDEMDDDNPLLISSKANELTYSRQNLLTSSRMITDLRPVFDKEGKSIKEMIVTHSLLIGYRSSDGAHELELTLDAQDIMELRYQCERAERKSNTTVEAMNSLPWNTVVPPEDEDAWKPHD